MTREEYARRRGELDMRHDALMQRYDELRPRSQELIELAAHALQLAVALRDQCPEGSPGRLRHDETIQKATDAMTRQAVFLNRDDPNEEIRRALEVTRADVMTELLPIVAHEVLPGLMPEVLR